MTKMKSRPQEEAPKSTHLQALAERQRVSNHRWGFLCWHLHNTFIVVGYGCQLLSVFGLAVLLFISIDWRNTLNIIVLVVSFVGFYLQLIDILLAFARRARVLQNAAATLEISMVRYADGSISEGEFLEHVQNAIAERHREND